ncbi:TPA: nucleoside kinase [Clostridium botulinum]|uniref:Nucleoside kinase n=2 Tax=Clostridium botulinum TaxID=1491 RepID=A0A846HTS2_CLOBO|nr:nucleoside kinase [Clostridium botulinum]AJD27266.1 phosphoribulokinase / Uridine kinase family protein [Clostridium botulinum CDC_297]ACQ52065.1 putative threonyl-tRNA synthetase/uridine kinase [Clostridium botulinum Ba4 str. 657]AJE12722.1 phosphoribulokinase / Uridine kinase family protein [Clostridium botulinum CDC_1436]APC79503.1 phosphoribulokinase / Uridine kinase family protein [Clostridium botulinum]APU59093.1 phosphoribulokinase / Uridine kinase family protein [Clostridium botulin
MEGLKLYMPNGSNILVSGDKTLYDVVKENKLEDNIPIVLGKIDEEYYELTSTVKKEGVFIPVDITDSIGLKTYVRTLQFIFIKAVLDLYPESTVVIEHSLGKGLYGEIHKKLSLNENDILKIKNKMNEIINKDIKIKKISVKKERAIEIFKEYKMKDKVRLLSHIPHEEVKLYELDGRYDYFYGPMAYSTGAIKNFDIMYYDPGFILRYPREKDPFNIPEFVEYKKLTKIFRETEKWAKILDVGDVGALNDKVVYGEIKDIIRVSEALHEKKIANIADMIYDKENIKMVLISGPSSSGKTTFANRLGIQLRVNALIPVPISLDNYFVNREDTPKDENGDYDFESIDALDIDLFNKDLKHILNGEEVQIPTFNFKKGKREYDGKKIKLPKNGILIVEGIHGLNPILTREIPDKNKFKIYISALTQLNIDNHNRVSTTDVRIIRRLVRDYLSRGYKGEETLKMWPSIKRGEDRNIFVFQENADVMFNSTIVYELCILKKYALAELNKIDKNSTVHYEATRLKSFLNFFKEVDMNLVPGNSILREFIGGSCFYEY